jgi:SNF2 domain-containing protein
MVLVRQDDPGTLTIDVSNAPSFEMDGDGVLLMMGLSVRHANVGTIVADDTGQIARVLAFIALFLADHGHEVSFDPDLTRLLRLYHEEQSHVLAVRSAKASTSCKLGPLGLARPLLPHQRKAVQHALANRNDANFSVPGSGKTQTALATFAAMKLDRVLERILIIGPASCFTPWEEEFTATFARSPTSVRLIGAPGKRVKLLRDIGDADLVLCTYQMAAKERDALTRALKRDRYLLVLDESHHIKNIQLGQWARTALELAPFAERRLILSGTPAPHSLLDLWSQFTFLWPSQAVLGSRAEFETRAFNGSRGAASIKKDLAPFFARTRKSDLGLPRVDPRFTKIPYRDIPERQRLVIRLLELRTIQEAKKLGLQRADVDLLRNWRKARSLRLLQAASNPALLRGALLDVSAFGEPFDDDPTLVALLRDYEAHETPVKIAFVVNEARRLVAQGEKVLIWATFVENLLLLDRLLKDLNPVKVYGAVPPYAEDDDPEFESRERNIQEFKMLPVKSRPILIANPAACSESVSLHKVCRHAIYLERTFNCGQFLQSMDRIHRVGMPPHTRPTYHIPVAECAVEQVLDRRLAKRQRVLYDILDDDMSVLGFEDESFLVDREDDLETIWTELLREMDRTARPNGNASRRR